MAPSTFFAFPNHDLLREIIERGITRAKHIFADLNARIWPQMDIAGQFISEEVTESIRAADIVFVDVTFPNFNVFYEAGFALGLGKQIVPTVCESFEDKKRLVSRLGLFDTIGQLRYQNSDDFAAKISELKVARPINFPPREKDTARPVFLLEPRIKGEGISKAKRRLETAKIQFRSFDPVEEPRLTLNFAYASVQQSVAIVTHLASAEETEQEESNLRAAFIIGLAHGSNRRVLILQRGNNPVPIDYRDFVDNYTTDAQFDQYFYDLAPFVLESLQTRPQLRGPGKRTLLERVEVGAPAAENEAEKLREYYLETDQTQQVLAGRVRLVVGRKGTGKSALFFHIHDTVELDTRNLVIPLRPDGAQIKRFKELVVRTLDEPAKEHVAKAFWEYVLLLEALRSFLNRDKQTHIYNHKIRASYVELQELFEQHTGGESVDFTDLLARFVHRLTDTLPNLERSNGLLTASQITRAMYAADIATLREKVRSYNAFRELRPWILIDNLDKGWPTRGVSADDVIILRGLIDATQALEQFMERKSVAFSSVVFIRNDVYEHLVDETPDRGKEAQISLDWRDPQLLKELLRRRFHASGHFGPDESFDQIWRQLSVSHVDGVDSFDYIVARSMMRPRNLISIVSYCRSNSINLKHNKITADDIKGALKSYSADVTREIGLELRDIYPEVEDILYAFLHSQPCLSVLQASDTLKKYLPEAADIGLAVELLLWFGFFGVAGKAKDRELFISDADYDLKKLLILAGGLKDPDAILNINTAFWPFLEINLEPA